MQPIVNWITANPEAVIGVAYLILNVINAALPHTPEAEGWRKVMGGLLDAVSVLTRRTAAGTIKAPFVASKSIEPPPG